MFTTKPCNMTYVITIHNIVRNNLLVNKSRSNSTCSCKNICYCIYILTFIFNHSFNKWKQLIFITQISTIIYFSSFIFFWRIFILSRTIRFVFLYIFTKFLVCIFIPYNSTIIIYLNFNYTIILKII